MNTSWGVVVWRSAEKPLHFRRKHRGKFIQGDYNSELLPQPTNPSVARLPHIFSVWNQLVFSNCLLCYIFEMSDKIFKLICQNGLSAEKQQEVVGLIASASKAEVEYKVSPKQQHLSLFIVFDLVLIASFHFFFHPPWFRVRYNLETPASSWLHGVDIRPWSPPCWGGGRPSMAKTYG